MQLDLNSKTLLRRVSGQLVTEALDRAAKKRHARNPKRDYLGGSYLASDCERAIQYQYELAEREREFPPHVLRIFERGHEVEDMVAEWLRDGGFVLQTKDETTGRQFGFSSAADRFLGHADGRLVGYQGEGAVPCALPALWENKCLNSKGFNAVVRHGVKKAKPVYWGQIVLYQYHLGLTDHPAVLTVVNADTMDLHTELVPWDPAECQRLIDRAVRILEASAANDRLPRCSSDPEHFVCRFCDYAKRCWAH